MKRSTLLTILLACAMLAPFSVYSQESSQTDRPNELYGGYGAFSVYYFNNNTSHEYASGGSYYYYESGDPSSAGTFFLGYNRLVNRFISVGIVFSYMHATNTLTGDYNYYDTIVSHGTSADHLISCVSRVNFLYLRKPFLTLYSGAAIGVTVDLNKATIDGAEYSDRKLKPAGQLTLFGIRAGKALGGFLEFGVGSNGILTAGISYKIKD
jgi:hypothetical protein